MKNSTTGIYRYISIGSSQPQVYFMKTVLQVYADIHRKFTATLYEIVLQVYTGIHRKLPATVYFMKYSTTGMYNTGMYNT